MLGLCNNFAYVIMLSAAKDILSDKDKNGASKQIYTNTFPALAANLCIYSINVSNVCLKWQFVLQMLFKPI